MKFKLSDTTYDVMKWVCIIVLPALATLLETFGIIWEWSIPTQQIVASIVAVDTFLGIILGISCYQYNKENKEE